MAESALLKTGIDTKIDKNRASAIKTEFEGACCKPSAFRKITNTTESLTKEVSDMIATRKNDAMNPIMSGEVRSMIKPCGSGVRQVDRRCEQAHHRQNAYRSQAN